MSISQSLTPLVHIGSFEHTIESEMFGERFYHSGNSAKINKKLVKLSGFKILMDKIDQPGNQVVLARKESL